MRDGQEAIHYLMGEGKYSDRNEYPFPTILLTDLKMPKRNGLEVLQWIKEHENCRVIPTIIFSASAQFQDVEKAYALGANSYVQKPSTFEELTILLASLLDYWGGGCSAPRQGMFLKLRENLRSRILRENWVCRSLRPWMQCPVCMQRELTG